MRSNSTHIGRTEMSVDDSVISKIWALATDSWNADKADWKIEKVEWKIEKADWKLEKAGWKIEKAEWKIERERFDALRQQFYHQDKAQAIRITEMKVQFPTIVCHYVTRH